METVSAAFEGFNFYLTPSRIWKVCVDRFDEEPIRVDMREGEDGNLVPDDTDVVMTVEFLTNLQTAWDNFKKRPEYQLGRIDFSDMESMRISYENQLLAIALIRAKRNNKGIDESRVLRQITKCIDWLRTTDMYTAPASTIYHNSEPGGLLKHTLSVVKCITQLAAADPFNSTVRLEDAILVACVHDWCKIGLYEKFMRNVKDEESGKWQSVPSYRYKEERMSTFGHGVSSMFLAQKFFNLSVEEALAVRWHMGEYNVADNEMNELHQANSLYPICYLLQFADRVACTKYGEVR